jgi:hypothetical protein
MKKIIIHIVIWFVLLLNNTISAQQKSNSFIELNPFYGIVIEHDKSLKTAIQGNPFGLIVSYNIKNTKEKEFLKYYNYPDFGFSVLYENTNSDILGEIFGAYTHYNFYLNNRNAKNKLSLRIAFGLAHITKPYNSISNPYNFALASKYAGTAFLKLNYQRFFLKNRLGFQTGMVLTHFSNAGIKNPNLGLNTLGFNFGLNYNFNNNEFIFDETLKNNKVNKKLKYNLIFRTGKNESKNIGSGNFSFYVLSFKIDKKINYKSTLTTGIDFFESEFLKDYIDQDEPQPQITNTKRIGIFVGHDLKINKINAITQIGYHAYYPKKYVSRVYERVGFNYFLNQHFFTELTLKINLFRAEMLEFGLGYRL